MEAAASGRLTPPAPASGTEALLQSPAFDPRGSAWRRNSRLLQPLPPFPTALMCSPGATPLGVPLGPEPPGSGSGDKEGCSLQSQRTPARWFLQDLPTPALHSLEASHCPPSLPPDGTHPVFPPAQDPPDNGFRTKKPGCSGRARGHTALMWQVNTRGPLATTLPILPRLPPPGRDTPFPLSRLPGDAAAARRARGPRGSGSRLTVSGELDLVRAPARARRPPQTASGAGSALFDRLAKSARGTAQSRTGPESQ